MRLISSQDHLASMAMQRVAGCSPAQGWRALSLQQGPILCSDGEGMCAQVAQTFLPQENPRKLSRGRNKGNVETEG